MKKLFILTLAVLSFVACNDATKSSAEAKEPIKSKAVQTAKAKPEAQAKVKTEQPVPVEKDYILPALKGKSYNFTKKINQKPVVVAFMAGFCGWCKKMIPYMDDLAKQVPTKKADVIIAFMDPSSETLVNLDPVKGAEYVDIYYNSRDLMMEHGVNGFPTIILFKDGKKVNTWRGYSPDHVESILQALKNI